MDREKVIKGLEDLRENMAGRNMGHLYKACCDALALLKEQENCENCAIAIEDRQPVVRCKDCINCVKEPNGELYCDILAVGYEPLGSKKVTEDWFCADGKPKEGKCKKCGICDL